MRLLLFNIKTDERAPLLGFACGWVRALAQHCEGIDIITMQRGTFVLPAHVRVFSLGRERGLPRPLRLLNFYRHLLGLLATRTYDACFAHMTPLFAGLAGPALRACGIPLALWYTHRQRSAQLRLGAMMASRVLSAHESSFPYPSDKLRVLGHGIDGDLYKPLPAARLPAGRELRLVQVGRLAAIKHQKTTLQAAAATDFHISLVGGTQTGTPPQYERGLRRFVQEQGLERRVQFTGEQPPKQALGWIQRATVAVNLSPPGLFDKAALESMACAVPTIVANPAFAALLGEFRDDLLVAGSDDVAGLRERLERLARLSTRQRASMGMALRTNVLRAHSLQQLVPKLVSVLATGELP